VDLTDAPIHAVTGVLLLTRLGPRRVCIGPHPFPSPFSSSCQSAPTTTPIRWSRVPSPQPGVDDWRMILGYDCVARCPFRKFVRSPETGVNEHVLPENRRFSRNGRRFPMAKDLRNGHLASMAEKHF
jgi:hypothetical protein